MKKTTLKLKKTPIIALIAIAFCLTNAPELKAQELPFSPLDFSIGMDFTRTEINLGYYETWGDDVWLAKEPYNVSFRGRVEPMPYLNDVYPLKLAVYINRPYFVPPDAKSGKRVNGKDVSKRFFKVPEDADPKLLKKYNIGPERINYKNPEDAEAARLRQSEITIQKILSVASKEKQGRGPSMDDPSWRNDYIKIAPLPPQIDPVCEIRKDMQTTCDLGEIPVNEITRLVTININDQSVSICRDGQCPSEGENFWVNDTAIAVAEVKNPNYNPSNPDSQEYLPVKVQAQGVGNLESVTIDATASKYTQLDPNVYFTYNLLPSMPVNAYGVILKDWNAFCLWDYDVETFNSVYDAIHGTNGMPKGGYEGGFERFKQTVQAACGDDVIGFVKLNKKTPQGWQGWKGWVIEEPSVVMLGEKEGCPFAVDSDRTIASGGEFSFSEFVISDDPEALRTLPKGSFPGNFSGGTLIIPPADNPPKPCKPDVGIDDPSIANLLQFFKNSVVINDNGQGTLYVYDMAGKMITTINVNNNQRIDLSQLFPGIYALKYQNKRGHVQSAKMPIVP